MRSLVIGVLSLLTAAGCGGSDDSSGTGGAGGSAGSGGSGGQTLCEQLGPNAYVKVELSGAVTQSIDWKPADMTCGGSVLNSVSLGWVSGDLELLITGIALAAGQTGSGTGKLSINAGDTSYATDADACSFDISKNEEVSQNSFLVEGTGSCGPLDEVGGSGAITASQLSFASYALGG